MASATQLLSQQHLMAVTSRTLDFPLPAAIDEDIIIGRIALGDVHANLATGKGHLHIDTRPVEADAAVIVMEHTTRERDVLITGLHETRGMGCYCQKE